MVTLHDSASPQMSCRLNENTDQYNHATEQFGSRTHTVQKPSGDNVTQKRMKYADKTEWSKYGSLMHTNYQTGLEHGPSGGHGRRHWTQRRGEREREE